MILNHILDEINSLSSSNKQQILNYLQNNNLFLGDDGSDDEENNNQYENDSNNDYYSDKYSNESSVNEDQLRLNQDLFQAVEENDIKSVENLLIEGANPNYYDENKDVVVFYEALVQKNIDIIILFLQYGYKISWRDIMRVIMIISTRGNKRNNAKFMEILRLLLEYTNEDDTYLVLENILSIPEEYSINLVREILENHPNILQYHEDSSILLNALFEYQILSGFQQSSQVRSKIQNLYQIIELLLKHGADPNEQNPVYADDSGFIVTPFSLAVQSGDEEIMKLLIRHGARPELNKNEIEPELYNRLIELQEEIDQERNLVLSVFTRRYLGQNRSEGNLFDPNILRHLRKY